MTVELQCISYEELSKSLKPETIHVHVNNYNHCDRQGTMGITVIMKILNASSYTIDDLISTKYQIQSNIFIIRSFTMQ